MSGSHTLVTTKVKISDNPSFNTFNFKLLLGSIKSPEKLLPIQPYPFNLFPLLRGDTYKTFDLVFDLDAGLDDVEIQGELQYTNGWIIKIHDQFNLDLFDDDGTYGPGGRIIIRRIEVKNTGDMPIPTSYDVGISINLLSSSEISLPKDNKLKLPKPIKSSEKKILNPIKSNNEECLEFQINQQSKASKDRSLKLFDISYKNITRINWRINNISNIDFGPNSNIKRVIKVQVKIEKMSPKNSLKFKTNQGLKDKFEQEFHYWKHNI
ncbi:hypothetical protein C1645_811585 [Glomus cerebriforme]|uniref:DUF7932 domain-containing protein n=1 Tax=Glomus cerebriforme TaxID=658196 RepID=A0A397TQZ6_9GLOM|nr:hypothetical protein C1645_811585 [Glomus cerebriforme]